MLSHSHSQRMNQGPFEGPFEGFSSGSLFPNLRYALEADMNLMKRNIYQKYSDFQDLLEDNYMETGKMTPKNEIMRNRNNSIVFHGANHGAIAKTNIQPTKLVEQDDCSDDAVIIAMFCLVVIVALVFFFVYMSSNGSGGIFSWSGVSSETSGGSGQSKCSNCETLTQTNYYLVMIIFIGAKLFFDNAFDEPPIKEKKTPGIKKQPNYQFKILPHQMFDFSAPSKVQTLPEGNEIKKKKRKKKRKRKNRI